MRGLMVDSVQKDAEAVAMQYVKQAQVALSQGYTHFDLVMECRVTDGKLQGINIRPQYKAKVA